MTLATPTLSVVMPVHNEAEHLPATIDALLAALEGSGFDAELVLVDDGSVDGSADVVRVAAAGRLPLRVLRQPNRGRFEARRAGLEAAQAEWVLLLDGRVRVSPDALRFVATRLDDGERVWTAHVEVVAGGNPYGLFWKLLAELAWREYFDRPRTTSFDATSFDRFPKGTTCFLAPRQLLLEAVASFRSCYRDVRRANDDTPLLRWIAERERIHVSPSFSCRYLPRRRLSAFLRHSLRRGVVFVDGHGTPASRFFPAVVAFYPASALLALAVARRPRLAPALVLATGLAAALYGVRARRSADEVRALALVTPLYALAHGLGMWKGLALLAAARLSRREP